MATDWPRNPLKAPEKVPQVTTSGNFRLSRPVSRNAFSPPPPPWLRCIDNWTRQEEKREREEEEEERREDSKVKTQHILYFNCSLAVPHRSSVDAFAPVASRPASPLVFLADALFGSPLQYILPVAPGQLCPTLQHTESLFLSFFLSYCE